MTEKITELSTKTIEKIQTFAIGETPGGSSIGDKMEQLFPSIWIIIATLGSLCILLIILTKFLYNPVKKMVQRRKDFIQKNIDESVQVKKEAYDLESEARAKLQESKHIGNEIISKAKMEAEEIKAQYIEQGKEEANRIVRETKDNIKAKKKALEQEAYNEIVSVAMEISEKIIKDKISEKETRKYLDEYLGR